jgi:ribosomal protein S12 methylthiotransferase
MLKSGHRFTENAAEAEVIIVSTCAFIEAAVEESIDTILDYAHEFPEARMVVTGCLPLRYKDRLADALHEADLFLTPDRIRDFPERIAKLVGHGGASAEDTHVLQERVQGFNTEPPLLDRVLTTPGYAYLKISEGCSRRCGYCTIPSIRGPLRSRSLEDLEAEASALVSQGVRELVLIAQDVGSYGRDLGMKNGLIELLDRLTAIPDVPWIRLMYLYPETIDRELPKMVNDRSTILPYLDIPLQHVSENVLKSMGRSLKGESAARLIERLRRDIPGVVLRTTFMVGYPTETDADFAALRRFTEEQAIEHVGVFSYSPEEGTRAFSLGDPIPANVKQARAKEILNISVRQTIARNEARIGTIEQCLVEGYSDETDLLLQARTWDQAPEVDGCVLVTAGRADRGSMRQIRITEARGVDLIGELLDPDSAPDEESRVP